jgi:hypothetical protein
VSDDPVEAIVRAVLYEGYLLYPYTRSAAKNQVRFPFGGVYPPAWETEPSEMRTECLLQPGRGCGVRVQVRCLHLVVRSAEGEVPWQEAMEQTAVDVEAPVESLLASPLRVPVELEAGRDVEAGTVREWQAIQGLVTVAASAVDERTLKLTVHIENSTPTPPGIGRDEALLRALVSTHTVIRVAGGRLVSLAAPPLELAEAASACDNVGTWPALAGVPGSHDVVLSSPIILEDYARVADESPGDLFDSTEIDEILTLRILTLTDAEKAELRRTDERARRLLERTESLTAEQLMRLHGTLRDPHLVTRDPG